MQSHQGRVICRNGDHDRAAAILGSENALDEFFHFTAALADHPDDDDVCARIARHHSQENALTHAAAGEQADALSAADCQKGVDGSNADVERFGDGLALQRIDGFAGESYGRFAIQRAEAVQRLRRTVDDSSQELRSDTHRAGALARNHSRVGSEAVRIARRHQVQPVA